MCWSWIGSLVLCATLTLTDAECHCNTTAACAVFPSTPCSKVGDPDRCQEGWYGSYCQKQNIALRRSCHQSSKYNNKEGFGVAEWGVDGTVTTVFNESTCAHTNLETNPTWTVNLNTSFSEKIQHITLYLRRKYLNRNNGMEILVGRQMCYNWSSTEHPPAIAYITCRQPLTGTTVTIRIPGQRKYLTLCEVQIFVCSDGWFSEDCDKQCRCLNSTDVCDKITGHCSSGCSTGHHGPNCQTACPDGFYGVNCVSRCGNCINGVICNRTTGTCPRGCAAGWMNSTCLQECPDGSYGIDCTSQCGNCLNGVSCNKTTGTCSEGCAAGWMNDDTKLCGQSCPDGFFGMNCAFRCGSCFNTDMCDKRNGTCPVGCAAGWVNDGTCLQLAPKVDGFNWGVPVAVILSVLLIITVIGGTIYIRRLRKQLESMKNKTSEEHYVTLDEKTKVPQTESTYEHIANATPYYNTVNRVQDETG